MGDPMKRLVVLLVSVLLAALCAPPSVASPAEPQSRAAARAAALKAATRHAVTQNYTHNWVWHPSGDAGSGLNNKCVFYEVKATIKGSWYYTYGDNSSATDKQWINWENVQIVSPSITAVGWPESGAGCDSTQSVKLRGRLGEAYYSQSCKISVDLAYGVGADATGFSVGVEANPSYRCSKDKVGWSDYSWSCPVNKLGIFNNGAALRFHDINLQSKEWGTQLEGAWDIYAGFGQGPVAHIRQTANPVIHA